MPRTCRMCTKFGVDSSSRFRFRLWTHRHTVTDATDHPTHSSATAGVGSKNGTRDLAGDCHVYPRDRMLEQY